VDMKWLLVGLLFVAYCGFAVSVGFPADARVDVKIEQFAFQDYLGTEHSFKEWRDKRAVVVVFLGTECPLAKLYGPRLTELEAEYGPRGVAFVGIASNQQDSLLEIGQYVRVHKIGFPILKDPSQQAADQFGATRTPEAFVLDSRGEILYRGRIDDQFGIGYQRAKEVRRDLAIALGEILANKPVSTPITEPVGCYIGRIKPKPPTGEISYTNQIARLVDQHCVRCHRPGQIAPFTLTSYGDVSAWAETMCEVIDSGRMPPWHANPQYGHFANDAQLSAEDKQLFHTWVDNGMPEGDAADLPEPTIYSEGWQIPKPDVVVRMPEPFTVPAKGTVPYQYFVADTQFEKDIWIRGAEVRPGNPAVVHHIILFLVPPGQKAASDNDPLLNSIATFAPGMPAELWPTGYARYIPAGSKLVFQVHYTPNGSEQTDQSEIGLVFADPDETHQELKGAIAVNTKFRIPPGDPNYFVAARRKFKRKTLLHAMMPHMHYRGKSFRYTAEYPDGRHEILLDVPKYDFNWQNLYALVEPKLLPKGTVIRCAGHFDNSDQNLSNPDPTAEVCWGDQTWEEMMLGSMIVSHPN